MPVPVLMMPTRIGSDLSFLDHFGDQIEVLDATREGVDLDPLLARAEVALIGFPVPPVVVGRAPQLRWVHHPYAGVSNLFRSDLWTSDVMLTSTRGDVGATAIAEYAIAGALFFGRGLDTAVEQKHSGVFTPEGYAMTMLRNATMGIVGLGGIGREVARIAKALGMRVIASRRSISAPTLDVGDVDILLPAAQLHDLLAESDYVVVCSQLTAETRNMFDERAFAAMKPGAVFVNVARGEEVDEEALIQALRRGHLKGALLDVHANEPDRLPPRPELTETPNLVLTPHVSTLGDDLGRGARQLFTENLHHYLRAEPLRNVVDRARGY